jgi:hypothetical protein
MKNGILEYWDVGILEERITKSIHFNPPFHYSTIPSFQVDR